jgi:hypothetical protein
MKNLIFFLQPTGEGKTGEGLLSHKLELIFSFLRVKIYWQAANKKATNIFSMVFPYSDLFPFVSM